MVWTELAAITAIRDSARHVEPGWEDTTLVSPAPGGCVVLSSDQINARQAYPGEDLRSLVRRGLVEALSDLAAAGADVVGVQIDVRAPADFTSADFTAIGTGVNDVLRTTGGLLLQGSNLSRGEFGVSSTVVGTTAAAVGPLRRHGTRPGDLVLLSGPIGGWNGALAVLNSGQADTIDDDGWLALREDFLDYRAELAFGRELARSGLVTASVDCNDALPKTAQDLARAGGVRLVLDAGSVPLARSARTAATLLGRTPVDIALTGLAGDDRLLFTVGPGNVEELCRHLAATLSRQPTVIGVVEPGEGVCWQRPDRFSGTVSDTAVSDAAVSDTAAQAASLIYTERFFTSRPLALPGFDPQGRVLNVGSARGPQPGHPA